ncbi:hypothetical protein SPOG_05729 [Schizosaccharomyces cryophilus OY26]|uniref:Uncharacterized protein n=1 Tax=Schizosaccharomyces cryophilus (strain OY26 / ATCC MYA-4695 / CBS 11777 / NBRC 106824 / NRRL Y48691) TaxID=653667 RepID=S9W8E9_SCHCR|nr:uncharacterized protein SPOG_05729 [Schizosaccharomyces cryophilus OY26]EPY54105.1 hypothetical protein SPOG_05729 [Schizosaccharomyces cryophilus OY26]
MSVCFMMTQQNRIITYVNNKCFRYSISSCIHVVLLFSFIHFVFYQAWKTRFEYHIRNLIRTIKSIIEIFLYFV